MATANEYSTEELNYFRICFVTVKIIASGLREVFKRQWDASYESTHGKWEDTPQNGKDFKDRESPKKQKRISDDFPMIADGNTLDWDCSCLSFAILRSDSIGKHLHSTVRNEVNELRKIRNTSFAHCPSHTVTEDKFQTFFENVLTAFRKLNLDTSDIEKLRNQRTFPTEELRLTQELLEKEKMRNEEPRAFCVLPAKPSHEVFTREEETMSILQEMEKLKNAKPNEITVTYLSGNPGSGKSELARQIGKKVFDTVVPDNETAVKFVFTLNASSIDALVESYVEFAVSMNCDEEAITSIGHSKDSSHEMKLNLLKSLVAPKLRKYSSWLMIIDNVTDLKSVFQHLPKAGEKIEFKGQILVTTQDSKSIADDSHTYHLSLSHGMNSDEAMKTLSAISGIPPDEKFSSKVVTALDSQPLALACAAVYMKRVRKTKPTFSWEEYLQKLNQGKRQATEGEYRNTSIAYSKTMTVAVQLALEKEISEDPVMKESFTFLSVMAPERIPLEYVVQYVTSRMPDEDEELVAANIVSSSLILSFESQSQEIRVHQVVHGCINTFLRPSNTVEFRFLLNAVKAFSTLLTPFDERNVDSIITTKSLVVHFVHISNKLLSSCGQMKFGEDDDTLANQLLSVGRICKVHGKNKQAHSFFDMCLKMKENIYGENDPALATTWNQLGGILGILGKHEEASKYFERALAIQEQAGDENSSELASTLNNYGINLQDRGLYTDAKDRLEKALDIEMRLFGSNSTAVATTLSNLGNCLDYLGQPKEAIDYFSMALDIEIEAFGQYHPHVASTLSNLGNSLGELGKHKEAEECLRRALAIEEMIFGPNHLTLAITLNNLGNTLGYLEKHQEAKDCFERALDIEEMAYEDPNHPELASTLSNLGDTLDDLEKHQEAEDYFKRALTIEEKALGPNHPDVATTLYNLGKCLGYQGKNRDARPQFERALAIEEKAHDQNHPTLATTLNNLGLCHLNLGENRESEHCFKRALAIQQRALDPDHPDVATTLNNLGKCHLSLGENREAEHCFKRALAIQQRALDPDHPDVATTLNNLGKCLGYQGENRKAEHCFKRALAIQQRALDPDHPDLASTMENLALFKPEK